MTPLVGGLTDSGASLFSDAGGFAIEDATAFAGSEAASDAAGDASLTTGSEAAASGASAAAEEGQMLFRGVPGNGTQKAILGQQGIAIPRGTALDEGSLIRHVLGEDVNAGVTSWTTERGVAARFSGPDGTIIEVPMSRVLKPDGSQAPTAEVWQ